MLRCTRCEGFVPSDSPGCPTCSKFVPRKRAGMRSLRIFGARGLGMTLMDAPRLAPLRLAYAQKSPA
jgi:hypothetical protein